MLHLEQLDRGLCDYPARSCHTCSIYKPGKALCARIRGLASSFLGPATILGSGWCAVLLIRVVVTFPGEHLILLLQGSVVQ